MPACKINSFYENADDVKLVGSRIFSITCRLYACVGFCLWKIYWNMLIFFKNIYVWTGLHLWNIFLVCGSFNHAQNMNFRVNFQRQFSAFQFFQEQRSIQHLFLLKINNRLCVWRVWCITWVCVIHSWCLLYV